MFFSKEKKQIETLMALVYKLEYRVETLQEKVDIQKIRTDALLKVYPNGINKDGSPRKKMGRPFKKETA